MLFNLKRKLQGTLIINNKSMDFFDLSSHRTPNFKHYFSQYKQMIIFDRKKDDTKKKLERVSSVSVSLETWQIDRSTRYHVWNGVRELLEGEAEGECARSSEIISWCPLQATKEEERKRTGLSQSFLDTRRSFYCEKLAG